MSASSGRIVHRLGCFVKITLILVGAATDSIATAQPLGVVDAAESNAVTIGIIAPLYEDDEHGRSHLQGAKAKFEEMKQDVSDATGLDLRLVVKDSKGATPEEESANALTHAKHLVEKDKAIAILGAVNSHATLAVQRYIESLQAQKAILITSSSTRTSITEARNDWTFRNNLSDRKLTRALASRLQNHNGIAKVAVFYKDSLWGHGAYEDFKAAYKGEIAYSEVVSRRRDRFDNALAQIADANAEAICIFGGDFAKYKILKAKSANSKTRGLPVFTIGLPHRLIEAGEQYLDNLTAVTSFYDDPSSEAIAQAKKTLERDLDRDLPPWARLHINFNSARALESMQILLTAIWSTGSSDPTTIRDTIREMRMAGLSYEISFDPISGDLTHEKPFFLNHYGQWLDLSNPRVFLFPILFLIGIGVLALLSYVLSARILRLKPRQSVFLTSLPVTCLLYVGNHHHWISVGALLSNLNDMLTWCGGIVAVAIAGAEVTSQLHKRKEEVLQPHPHRAPNFRKRPVATPAKRTLRDTRKTPRTSSPRHPHLKLSSVVER